MNFAKKDEISTNPKIEKLNSSDTECLKSSNDKILDTLTKTKIDKNDINSKSSKKMGLDREKSLDEEDDSFDDDDDDLKIEKKSIKIEKTTAAEVLNQPKLDPKENLNLLKFELCYLVKKEINWIVYHTPDEIQKFFKKIHRFIKNDESAMKVMKVTSLEKIKEYNNEQMKIIKMIICMIGL